MEWEDRISIRARADVIVTFNLKECPSTTLDKYDIEAQHPDEFISHQINQNGDAVAGAARRQRATMRSR